MPLPLVPSTLPAEVFAAAHALCGERGDLDDGTPSAIETNTAIDVLARHAPPSETQRSGVRLARCVVDDVVAGRRGPADLSGTGKQRPSLSDFVVALTGNGPSPAGSGSTSSRRHVCMNPKRTAAAHNIHHAINADARCRRHERGVYTRLHHG